MWTCSQTCPMLSKLYLRRTQRRPDSRHCVLLVMLLTSFPSQWKNLPLNSWRRMQSHVSKQAVQMYLKAKCRVTNACWIRKGGEIWLSTKEQRMQCRQEEPGSLLEHKGSWMAAWGYLRSFYSWLQNGELALQDKLGAHIIYKQLIHSSNVSVGSLVERKGWVV